MFLEQEGPLNPVLSGYFSKLVSLLISRKQKQLIPYVFDSQSVVIENLVKHVGSKSISEVLNKLMTQVDQEDMQAQIQSKQGWVISNLLNYLGPEHDEETNLNACSIMQDMVDNKDFFNIMLQSENLQKVLDFACAGIDQSTKASKTTSLYVINDIISHHLERAKKKEQSKNERKEANAEDEDDIIV